MDVLLDNWMQSSYLIRKVCYTHIKVRQICLEYITNHHMEFTCLRTGKIHTVAQINFVSKRLALSRDFLSSQCSR